MNLKRKPGRSAAPVPTQLPTNDYLCTPNKKG